MACWKFLQPFPLQLELSQPLNNHLERLTATQELIKKRKEKNKLRKGDHTTSMDYGNGDVAVGQRSTHATRRIQIRNPEESGLTTGH